MAMPRPSGKAFKIALQTIPGMRNKRGEKVERPKKVPNDAVEMAIVEINENRGRLK